MEARRYLSKSFITGLAIVLLILISMMMTCTKVGPKESGFVVNNWGDYRGVKDIPLVTGINFYIPFKQHIEKAPTTMEHLVWSDDKTEGEPIDQAISIFCQGGAGFHINVGLNVHITPAGAPRIWLRWKNVDLQEIMKTWGRNMIRGVCNEASGKISADSLLNNFTVLEQVCRKGINDSLAAYGFGMDGFNIISKPKAIDPLLEAAINRKIIAKQDAETEVQNIQKKNAIAQQRAAEARGDSSYNVIEAAGKAEAIQKLHEQLTPLYVEYIKWTNWKGEWPSTVAGEGTNFLFNMPSGK